MTGKRFTLDDDGIVVDKVDLSMYIDNEDCCEKLNELHEENKDLEEARLYYQENFLTMKTEKHQLKEENEQLKSDIILIEKRADTVYDEIEQIKKDLKVALPVLLTIDFKMSINECEAMNRLAKLLDDDFIVGKDCDKND